MALFGKRDVGRLVFGSRAEAFAYMLTYQVEEKHAEPMEAAQKANEFADIYASNMGLPAKIELPKDGVEKYIQMAEKIGSYCEQHPRAIEFLTGAVTFAAGLFTGKTVEQTSQVTVIPSEKIDFSEID